MNSEVVEQIYKRNPILRHSHHPLHSPLLPLPYGDIHLSSESHEDGDGFINRLISLNAASHLRHAIKRM